MKIEKYIFGIYCAGLIIMNVLAAKTIDIAGFTVTTGIFVSPLIFVALDIETEIFGYKRTKEMIISGYIMNFAAILLFLLAVVYPQSKNYNHQHEFSVILSSAPRIVFASFAAYMSGSLINAKIMDGLKKRFENNLFVRAISSTIAGQFIDNALFSSIAFAGVLPVPVIFSMAVGATLFETIYEIIFFPITKLAINKLKSRIN